MTSQPLHPNLIRKTDARHFGVDSHKLTLELRKMEGSLAHFASPAIKKVAGSASADVDAIILRQAEIEDFGAAVIEGDWFTPSDLGQLSLKGWVTAT
ncbi:MAG TPA: hypothetical protein VGF82_06275 [Terracidiphilus sp.]